MEVDFDRGRPEAKTAANINRKMQDKFLKNRQRMVSDIASGHHERHEQCPAFPRFKGMPRHGAGDRYCVMLELEISWALA